MVTIGTYLLYCFVPMATKSESLYNVRKEEEIVRFNK